MCSLRAGSSGYLQNMLPVSLKWACGRLGHNNDFCPHGQSALSQGAGHPRGRSRDSTVAVWRLGERGNERHLLFGIHAANDSKSTKSVPLLSVVPTVTRDMSHVEGCRHRAATINAHGGIKDRPHRSQAESNPEIPRTFRDANISRPLPGPLVDTPVGDEVQRRKKSTKASCCPQSGCRGRRPHHEVLRNSNGDLCVFYLGQSWRLMRCRKKQRSRAAKSALGKLSSEKYASHESLSTTLMDDGLKCKLTLRPVSLPPATLRFRILCRLRRHANKLVKVDYR